MIGILVVLVATPSAGLLSAMASPQGPAPPPPTWGRPSDAIVKSQSPIVAAKVRGASAARVVRAAKTAETNRNVERRVANAPRGVGSRGKADPKLPEVTDYIRRFVGSVRIQVVNELGAAVPNLAVRGHPAPENSVTDKEGWVKFENIRLPAAISMDLDPKEKEFDLDGEQGKGVVTSFLIPTEIETVLEDDSGPAGITRIKDEHPEYALRQLRPTHDSRVRKGIEVRDGARVTVFEETWSHVIAITSSEKVTVRRNVADFALPKDVGIQKLRNVKPAVYLGERRLPLADSGDSWRFRADREMLGDQEATVVVQFDADGLGYGGEVHLRDLTKAYYNPINKVPRPEVGIESIGEGAVKLGGRTIDDAFPLTPLQWSENANSVSSKDGGIRELSGQTLMSLLGVQPSAERPPGPGNQRWRYGVWYEFPAYGLMIRCRRDGNQKEQIWPSEGRGIPEAIRVVSESGGSIAGVLRVGASQADVLNHFGLPDSSTREAYKLLFKTEKYDPAKLGRPLFGDPKYEVWDDTFFSGGIRVKWERERVKWFEIARPVQLLFNGTKAYVAPPAKAVHLRRFQVEGTSKEISASFERSLSDYLGSAYGMRAADSIDEAELVVDANLSVSMTKDMETHQYLGKVPKKDRRGNIERDRRGNIIYVDKWLDESVRCPVNVARIRLSANIRDAQFERVLATIKWTHNATSVDPWYKLPSSGQSGHKQGRRCSYDPETSVRAGLYGLTATSGSRRIEREFKGRDSLQVAVDDAIADSALPPLASELAPTGSVTAINYETGEMLVNLGKKHGIRDKGKHGGTVFSLFLLTAVDPRTGKGSLRSDDNLGVNWLELQRVGPDWCIVEPKKKNKAGGTETAYDMIPRLIDPGSGLLRVRVARSPIAGSKTRDW